MIRLSLCADASSSTSKRRWSHSSHSPTKDFKGQVEVDIAFIVRVHPIHRQMRKGMKKQADGWRADEQSLYDSPCSDNPGWPADAAYETEDHVYEDWAFGARTLGDEYDWADADEKVNTTWQDILLAKRREELRGKGLRRSTKVALSRDWHRDWQLIRKYESHLKPGLSTSSIASMLTSIGIAYSCHLRKPSRIFHILPIELT